MSVVTCNDLPIYVVNDCPEYKLTGLSHIGLLKFDHAIIDFDNATQWNTAITAGNAIILGGSTTFKGVYTPSEVNVASAGACGPENVMRNIQHELAITDSEISDINDTFYEALNGFSGYVALRYCNEAEIRVFDSSPSLFAMLPPANPDSKEIQRYSGMARWESDKADFGTLWTEPTGIFT